MLREPAARFEFRRSLLAAEQPVLHRLVLTFSDGLRVQEILKVLERLSGLRVCKRIDLRDRGRIVARRRCDIHGNPRRRVAAADTPQDRCFESRFTLGLRLTLHGLRLTLRGLRHTLRGQAGLDRLRRRALTAEHVDTGWERCKTEHDHDEERRDGVLSPLAERPRARQHRKHAEDDEHDPPAPVCGGRGKWLPARSRVTRPTLAVRVFRATGVRVWVPAGEGGNRIAHLLLISTSARTGETAPPSDCRETATQRNARSTSEKEQAPTYSERPDPWLLISREPLPSLRHSRLE